MPSLSSSLSSSASLYFPPRPNCDAAMSTWRPDRLIFGDEVHLMPEGDVLLARLYADAIVGAYIDNGRWRGSESGGVRRSRIASAVNSLAWPRSNPLTYSTVSLFAMPVSTTARLCFSHCHPKLQDGTIDCRSLARCL